MPHSILYRSVAAGGRSGRTCSGRKASFSARAPNPPGTPAAAARAQRRDAAPVTRCLGGGARLGLLDVRQLGEALLQVVVPARLDLALIRLLRISGVDALHHVHPLHHLRRRGARPPQRCTRTRTLPALGAARRAFPKGGKPWLSSEPLSPKLINICVVRVFGPALANVTYPLVFDTPANEGSSSIFLSFWEAAGRSGSGGRRGGWWGGGEGGTGGVLC